MTGVDEALEDFLAAVAVDAAPKLDDQQIVDLRRALRPPAPAPVAVLPDSAAKPRRAA